MTSVADTRLLLTLEFPPNAAVKKRIEELAQKEIARHLLAPSIILTEFIKIAGARLGEDGARTRLGLLRDRGMRTSSLGEEEALIAGGLLLAHRNVPIADALVASYARIGAAEYVVSDDPHYRILGVKTKWI